MASPTLLEPPTSADPSHTQAIVREAPSFLASQRSSFSIPYPLSLLVNSESQEKWASYETIFLASLRNDDEDTARICLRELTDRFGKMNERVLALQGMYDEATAKDDKRLNEVLKRYDEILVESPTMFSVQKRRATLLRSMGKISEAAATLVEILDASPTDAEAWTELADLYVSQGALDQAVFCLEEVLLVTSNAWNIHAKLGEVLYLSSCRADGSEQLRLLSESMRRFCRSVELCDDYLRGFYGLKLSTTRLLALLPDGSSKPSKSSGVSSLQLPTKATVQKLNQVATASLAEIIRRSNSGSKSWDGYVEAEIVAARELLAKDKADVVR